MSYSQGGEEAVILEAVKGIEVGNLIDIGAGDGKTFSNSRALLEKGWHGLLIEPDFEVFAKLFELYRENPNVKLVNAPVMMDPHPVTFSKARPEEQGLCSTAVDRNREVWKGHFSGQYFMKAFSPGELHSMSPIPDVVLVDTEGNSVDIALALCTPWASRVKLICIEHDGRDIEVANWGRQRGFNVRYLSAENVILVRG